jgi:hypothetical protein
LFLDGTAHCRNLLLLIDDDFLADAYQLRVMAVTQPQRRHIDGGPAMGTIIATNTEPARGIDMLSSIPIMTACNWARKYWSDSIRGGLELTV